ncbi:F0F1 ATP synthase subunit gamma [Fodinibius salsisoli]|uniref:F0F1 ATP synthase subunit gamma n=1 Tax=Fodinibius salsisoli TaxID=2820877 RepID=A0ABT3PIS4_9BACT|nr:F0F1 ATP synthase subunit gamma [Fodinibius salsisoli]MCW9705845.1 F0F1 ATP synthase subunit gamma [Fodinibius salsisoli]
MQKLEKLQRKIRSAEDLQSIVRTMKVMAAVGIHQFEQAVESLSEYYDTLERGLQVVLQKAFSEAKPFIQEDSQEKVGLIIMGAGQALCGPFDETISSYTLEQIRNEKWSDVRIYVLGERLAGYLQQQELIIDRTFEMPGSVNGINALVLELLSGMEQWMDQQIRSVRILHNKPVPRKGFMPRTQHLLPLNTAWLEHLMQQPWPTNNLPQYGDDSHTLFMALLRQYLFVSLFRGIAESLAAEYSGRLSAMQRAEQKIEERLEQLQQAFRNERQSTITDELLDIMAGFEAIK